jgi:hypothetical protein
VHGDGALEAIKPYAGCTLYEVSPETGLIVSHTEAWSITALDAFVSTIVPSFGAPPALDVSRHVDVEPPPLRLQPPPLRFQPPLQQRQSPSPQTQQHWRR